MKKELEKINRLIHEYMEWTSDQKTYGLMEHWVSRWPEIKLIREGREHEVKAKYDPRKYTRGRNHLILRGDCDDFACSAVEAAMEKTIAKPDRIGVAVVLTPWGARENPRAIIDHAIAIFKVSNYWYTIDSSIEEVVPINHVGYKYHKVMLMSHPNVWTSQFSFS